jgi:pectate lyase
VGFGNPTGGKGGTLCTVTNLNDSGTNSLRDCATRAGAYWVVFGVSGTITLTSPLDIASNKTIDGRGADITIANTAGVGNAGVFQVGLWNNRGTVSSNVIIENLTFNSTVRATAIIMVGDHANTIWIDHVTIFEAGLDSEGINVGGENNGSSPFGVTVSWCHWPANQDKGILVSAPSAGNDLAITLTLHHNHFQSHARNPRITYAKLHMFNNYLHNISESGMQAVEQAQIYSENDIFDAPSSGFNMFTLNNMFAPWFSSFACCGKAFNPMTIDNPTIEERNAGALFTPSSYYSYTPEVANETLRQKIIAQAGRQNVTAPSPTPTPTPTPTATPTPTPTSCIAAPYSGTAVSLPGTVQAEDYDKCSNGANGEGTTYHDTVVTNTGGQYRPAEGVDIETTGDTGGGYNVGWTEAGEWMRYAVNVSQAGTYTLTSRMATPLSGNTFHVEIDGTNVTGTITVPNTGGFQTYQSVSVSSINLTAGNHVMRVVSDSGGYNYNSFIWTVAATPTPTPSPVACSQYTPSSTIPTGYASPYDVVSSPSTNLMNVTCLNLTDARIDLGKGDPLQYIYNGGYLFKTGGTVWTPISYTSTESLIANAWYPKTATTNVSLTSTELANPSYALVYICSWTGSSWKCGCRDSACTQSYWQIQSFKR